MQKQEYTDHLGNIYSSIRKLCEAHNINRCKVRKKMREGMSLQDAVKHIIENASNQCVSDGMGNTFPTTVLMCKHYKINVSSYNYRISQGMSTPEALTKPVKIIECEDYLGNHFDSPKSMCDFYNIPLSTYHTRKKSGWDLEKILTTPSRKKIIEDHLGNVYKNYDEMCAVYKITTNTFKGRINNGWPVKDALTTPIKPRGTSLPATDHLGNKYKSIEKMCQAYNIKITCFKSRMAKGWELEDALTMRPGETKKFFYDHLGNKYKTIKEMCDTHGIKQTAYGNRRKNGFSLEEALTVPVKKRRQEITDPFGNVFESIYAMCTHYGVNRATYKSRRDAGETMEEALDIVECPDRGKTKIVEVTDHLGNIYENIHTMCRKYNITYSVFKYREGKGLSLEKCLTDPITDDDPKVFTDHLGLNHNTLTDMCKYYNINETTYRNRILNGWNSKDALTTPVKKSTKSIYVRHGFKTKYITDVNGKAMYRCQCITCGMEEALTEKEMIEHQKEHAKPNTLY